MPTGKNTILIVEDEISLRNALRDKFLREGFTVFDAKDGEAGLSIALREQPRIILLDMIMPKMDGMTMLSLLRPASEWSRHVPVLLLTNLGADDKRIMREILNDASAYYLVKSNWSMDQIVERVKETITWELKTDAVR
jgi:DNA-binding response OmpR family regulator